MIRILIICLISMMLFFSCDSSSSPDNIDENMIREILQNIALAFNYGNIEEIMIYYHPDFLHNGDDLDSEHTLWELRSIEYNELEIENVEIGFLNDDYATASFILRFIGNSGSDSWDEPSDENGDLSYFFLDFSGWMIIGNQME